MFPALVLAADVSPLLADPSSWWTNVPKLNCTAGIAAAMTNQVGFRLEVGDWVGDDVWENSCDVQRISLKELETECSE